MSDKHVQDFSGTERYRVVRQVGAGGMGVVYEAYDRDRNARVALKTLPRADAMALYRFKREFRALADVVHPNLVALYQLISRGDEWFFTMEFVEGCDFVEYVRPKAAATSETSMSGDALPSQTLGETIDYAYGSNDPDTLASGDTSVRMPLLSEQHDRLRHAMRQLADGLCHLHAAGKLHRDIKPSNVLVTREGRVVILDFGLVAEKGEPAAQVATERAIVGTVAYMSPEQAAGEALSEASDWYCVGAMLYQVLTGKPPFVGTKLQVMMDKQMGEPAAPSSIVRGIPNDIDTLCRDLLRMQPSARPTGAEVLRRLGGPVAVAADGAAARPPDSPRSIFVGRERHLAELDAALAAVHERRPVVVHVHGRSGAGKSWLVQHFLEKVQERDSVVVLSGRCFEQESVPYKALDNLVDALTRYLKRLGEHDAGVLLPRDVLALARLFPVLRRVPAIAKAPATAAQIPDQQELRRRAFTALRELLARIGDRHAFVMHIDDLQWGDVDSANLLSELLRAPDPPVLLLLCAYRSEYVETSPCLRVLTEAHAADAMLDCRQLPVAALEADEARRLALALLGPEARDVQAEAIARESEGSPFFIHELAQHVRAGSAVAENATGLGGVSLDDMLFQRIAKLPRASRRLLEAIAVSGKPLRQADAFEAAGQGMENPAPLTILRAGHFVRSTGPDAQDEVETYHDRVRETVVARLDAELLRAHHRNLAVVLELSGHADPETLGVHSQGAGDAVKAGHHYALAAAEAAEALAFDRAAKLYRLSLELRPLDGAEGCDLRRRLADALANAGRGSEAAQEYETAAAASEGSEALELLGRAGYQFCASGHIDEGRVALSTVLGRLGMKLPGTRNRALLSMLWHRFRLWLRGLKFKERAADDLSADELARIDISWSVAIGLTMIDTIRGADFQTRNLLLALKSGEPYRVARAMAWEATHAAMGGAGAKKRSAALLDAADALVKRLEQPHALGMAMMSRGVAAYFHGNWREGRDVCDRAVEVFRNHCTGVAWELDTASAFAFWSLWFMGELAELIRRFPILVKEAHERGDRLAEANYTTFGGPYVWLAADDPEGARQALSNVMGAWSRQDFHVQHFTTLTAGAQIELYRGDGQAAWQHIVEQWPAMAASALLHVECVRIFMIHLRARCALAHAAGAPDPAPLLKSAARDVRKLEREKPSWSRCMPLMIRAALADRKGDVSNAITMLAAATASAEAADMMLFAAAARRRQGLLVGGPDGAALVAQADAFMSAQKIQNPARMADLLAPGFHANR